MVDPYINTQGIDPAGVYAGEVSRSLSNIGTSYVQLMPRNYNRVGFEIEAGVANTGTVSIRYGTNGDEFELVGGGAHMRNPATGGVYVGTIFVKSTVGTDKVIAREW